MVHDNHGIGIYKGIETMLNNNIHRDYIKLEYKDGAELYLPLEQFKLVRKYVSKEGVVPKINKLGSKEWEKTKAKINERVNEIAERLVSLYSLRAEKPGFAFEKDDELQASFEKEFGYDLTIDQQNAVNEIKNDMERPIIMDRLLVGDVGFGKTEVAFRAIFKAINDGKQVAYLCPTTILSNQQYKNAIERFSTFPVNIALLNRFVDASKQKKIIEDLENGKVDILFGTHRILSNDIKFKDLGLLVIDEEQRFGVTHKEKIKQYKANIDVLTLSATPIPRTLQMSMAGIRSLALIETAPSQRLPIQTYVLGENNNVIKDAIYKELSRNGQVFILYYQHDYIK